MTPGLRFLHYWTRHPKMRVVIWMTLFVAFNVAWRVLLENHVLSLPWLILIWVLVLAAAIVISRQWVTPALAHTAPSHDRITRTAQWQSPLDPEEALDAIAHAVTAVNGTPDVRSTRAPGGLRLAWGSDETYRIKGSASDTGWAALPVAALFMAVSDGSGSRLTAEVRDDLGWYPAEPAPFVENEIHRRGDALIRRARSATEKPDASV